MKQLTVKSASFVVILLLCSHQFETKRVSSGGRRTSSSSSSSSSWGWSRPKPAPKPSTNYGFDNKKLSYGHDTAPAPRPAPQPSAPVLERRPATPLNANPNQNQPVGWNVPGNNQPKPNYGWNVNQPGQTGYNPPKPGQAPPPYPGAPSPGFGTHQNPPQYSTHNNPVGGPPPPYPGLGNQYHSPVGAQPPSYSGHGSIQPNYPRQQYQPSQQFPNYHSNYGNQGYGGYGSPGYGSGFGGYSRPGLGGFGGGGFGGHGGFGGYNPGFGYAQKSSGFGGIGSHVGTFLAGMMLMNLVKGSGSNYQVYHNYPTGSYQTGSAAAGSNRINVTHSYDKPNEAKVSVDFGNMTCITIYNSVRFAKWANRSIKNIEYQTKQAFPFANLDLNANNTGQLQFNFTIEPGKIVHNETVSITCCGTENVAIDIDFLTNGKSSSANCVHQIAAIPFRSLKVVPLNVTVNVTNNHGNITVGNTTLTPGDNSTMTNSTTNANVTTPAVTPVKITELVTEAVNVTEATKIMEAAITTLKPTEIVTTTTPAATTVT